MKKKLTVIALALGMVFSVGLFAAACGGSNRVESARSAFTAANGWTVTNLTAATATGMGAVLGFEEGFMADGPNDGDFVIIRFDSSSNAEVWETAMNALAALGGQTMTRRGNTVWGGTANALAVWNG